MIPVRSTHEPARERAAEAAQAERWPFPVAAGGGRSRGSGANHLSRRFVFGPEDLLDAFFFA
jgi:hypothetical protein